MEKYKEPHKERCNLERCYIDYTEGDFYFFLGKYYQGIAKKDYYKMAKDLFIKAINLLNINLDIDDNTFNKLTENEQKITVYFSNAVGQCNAHLMVIETSMSGSICRHHLLSLTYPCHRKVIEKVFSSDREALQKISVKIINRRKMTL